VTVAGSDGDDIDDDGAERRERACLSKRESTFTFYFLLIFNF
jgi:hypothetical protein